MLTSGQALGIADPALVTVVSAFCGCLQPVCLSVLQRDAGTDAYDCSVDPQY